MRRGLAFIIGSGIGGAIVYLLDPDRGKRRRALLRDQVSHTARVTGEAMGKTSRDILNRSIGLATQTRSLFADGETPEDDVLAERVRSKLGRIVSHPSAIEIRAERGNVTLSGPVLAGELDRLVSGIASVKGVTSVENRLEVHEKPGDVPGLQGQHGQRMEQFGLFARNWRPATRLLTALAGGLLALYGLRRRGVFGSFISTVGLGIITRGITNVGTERLLGVAAGRRAVDLQKTININAPVERVFQLWTDFENFPHFMSNVREVREVGHNLLHWKLAGPAGSSVEWDAEVTELAPSRAIAWKTMPGSPVQHAGRVHFDPNPDGSTRVDVTLSYNPGAGALGHVLASVLGADPKRQMDEDLVRMKTFVETGKTPADAAAGKGAHRTI